jgi:hypothetical protein
VRPLRQLIQGVAVIEAVQHPGADRREIVAAVGRAEAIDDAYDRDLLFAATVLHDLGTGALAKGEARFEVEGADLAADVLRGHGVAEPDIDRVWEAIALHTSPGIAKRRGLLAYLTREGVGIDFGRHPEIVSAWAPRIHAAYPRLAMVRSLVDAIVERAALTRRRAALLHRRSTAPRTPGQRHHRHGAHRRRIPLGE